MADKPTNRFKIPTSAVFITLDGEPMKEPGPDGKVREVTLGIVLGAALTGDAKVEGVSLNVLDRLTLARKFRDAKEPEIKIETLVAVKKLVAEAFKHSALIAGQALELLGDEPTKDL
jgi:hypothetical protein